MEVILSVRGIVTSKNAHFIRICIESVSSPGVQHNIIQLNNVNETSDRMVMIKHDMHPNSVIFCVINLLTFCVLSPFMTEF